MIQDLVNSIRVTLHERIKSPFLGAYSVSWAAFNFKLLVAVFSGEPLVDRIEAIDAYFFCFQSYIYAFLAPLITAGLYVFVWPYFDKFIYVFWATRQKEIAEKRSKIENTIQMSSDELIKLKTKHIEMQIEFEAKLKGIEDRAEVNARIKNEAEERARAAETKLRDVQGTLNNAAFLGGNRLSDAELEGLLIGNRFVLYFDPSRREEGAKPISFLSDGHVGDGANKNEYKWRVFNGTLKVLQESAEINSKFQWHDAWGLFISIADEETASKRNQVIAYRVRNPIEK